MKKLKKCEQDGDADTSSLLKNITKIILAIFIGAFILLLPLIYPIITKLIINIGFFKNIEEVVEYINIYKSIYTLAILGIIGVILFYISPNKENIFESLENIRINIGKGDSKVEIESNFQKDFKQIEQFEEESIKSKEEVQSQLTLFDNKDSNKDLLLQNSTLESQLDKTKIERDDFRFFAAYNITNQCSRKLLKKIKDNDKISVEEFNNILEKDFTRKIKNIYGPKKKAYITDKINTILFNLKYLNIIEYTEDGIYIFLTVDGIAFVKGMNEREG